MVNGSKWANKAFALKHHGNDFLCCFIKGTLSLCVNLHFKGDTGPDPQLKSVELLWVTPAGDLAHDFYYGCTSFPPFFLFLSLLVVFQVTHFPFNMFISLFPIPLLPLNFHVLLASLFHFISPHSLSHHWPFQISGTITSVCSPWIVQFRLHHLKNMNNYNILPFVWYLWPQSIL